MAISKWKLKWKNNDLYLCYGFIHMHSVCEGRLSIIEVLSNVGIRRLEGVGMCVVYNVTMYSYSYSYMTIRKRKKNYVVSLSQERKQNVSWSGKGKGRLINSGLLSRHDIEKKTKGRFYLNFSQGKEYEHTANWIRIGWKTDVQIEEFTNKKKTDLLRWWRRRRKEGRKRKGLESRRTGDWVNWMPSSHSISLLGHAFLRQQFLSWRTNAPPRWIESDRDVLSVTLTVATVSEEERRGKGEEERDGSGLRVQPNICQCGIMKYWKNLFRMSCRNNDTEDCY